ncbi:hypothetical protein FB451DRAFT_1241369 [Mycena latifolia]|nr:hypothetical protein FB451DRAFT_1241369 [Mycena latifolia]
MPVTKDPRALDARKTCEAKDARPFAHPCAARYHRPSCVHRWSVMRGLEPLFKLVYPSALTPTLCPMQRDVMHVTILNWPTHTRTLSPVSPAMRRIVSFTHFLFLTRAPTHSHLIFNINPLVRTWALPVCPPMIRDLMNVTLVNSPRAPASSPPVRPPMERDAPNVTLVNSTGVFAHGAGCYARRPGPLAL